MPSHQGGLWRQSKDRESEREKRERAHVDNAVIFEIKDEK